MAERITANNYQQVFILTDNDIKAIVIALRESGGSAAFEEIEDVAENLLEFFEDLG